MASCPAMDINYGTPSDQRCMPMTSNLAADSNTVRGRQQAIEPVERNFGIDVSSGEVFRDALSCHRLGRGASEGRRPLAADPRQKITSLFGVPATHQFTALETGVVFQANVIKRIIADMHCPKPPQTALREDLC